ncbi:hypothetical protein CSB37_03625 [bacterium DOLZORAL124_38_8]|nr:MAG: hypothetical protein CSB37_03625 [bacterium DOLZORAL124_38_8]
MNIEQAVHIPVLKNEILEVLYSTETKSVFDGTLGLGGHAKATLEQYPNIQTYYATDLDPQHLSEAARRLKAFQDKLSLHNTSFTEIHSILTKATHPLSILLDLGICSNHVDEAEKGFSFKADGPLKMSFSGDNAAEVFVNEASETEIRNALRNFGEMPNAQQISKEIVKYRQETRITRTHELKNLIETHTHPLKRKKAVTQAFQAIRIAVNEELKVIETTINRAFSVMQSGDKLGIITYHSLEDRLVKRLFKELSTPITQADNFSLHSVVQPAVGKLINKKPILPSETEIQNNPRSRSAKLRIIQKV